MCEPTALTLMYSSLAMSAATAVMRYQGAESQSKVQEANYKQNEIDATSALLNDYSQNQTRQGQENTVAAQQIQERTMAARREQSSAIVAGGEAGVSGFSMERILMESAGLAAADNALTKQNRDWSLDQLNNNMKGDQATANSRIKSAPRGQKVSALPFLIQAGSEAVGAYGTYKKDTAGLPKVEPTKAKQRTAVPMKR